MSLKILSTEPCWNNLYLKLKNENTDLCNKNITLSINQITPLTNTKNILWLHESPALLQNEINFIKNNHKDIKNYFDCIYTCIEELHDIPFVKKIHPSNSSWVENIGINFNKTKNISMIASSKNYTKGHKIRNLLVNNLPKNIDLYGRGYNEIDKKDIGLTDYMFSIAIENDDTDGYFSEKILDCFLVGTIPIYWGPKSIKNIFNPDGIIWLEDIKNLNDYDKKYYKSKESVIKENYFLALQNNIHPYTSLKNILIEN